MKSKFVSLLLSLTLLLSMTPTVSFASGTSVEILTNRTSDSSSFIKPPNGAMSKLTYPVILDGAQANAKDFDWSVSPQNEGVYVDSSGAVFVSGDTLLDSFMVTASLKSDPSKYASAMVELFDTVYYDFDSVGFSTVTPVAESDGNKYMQGGTLGDAYKRVTPASFTSGTGSATVSYDLKIGDAGFTTKYVWAKTAGWDMYIYANTNYKRLEIPAGYAGSSAKVISDSNLPCDKWINVKFEHDFTNGKYNINVGNSSYKNLSQKSGAGYTLSAMGFNYMVDNIRAYSGHDVQRSIDIKYPVAMTVPSEGEVSSKLSADVFAGSLKISEPVLWELLEDYNGVSINEDTIIVQSGAPSVVKVKASLVSNPEVCDEFEISLTEETLLDFSQESADSVISGSYEIKADSAGDSYLNALGTLTASVNPLLQNGSPLVISADIHSINGEKAVLSVLGNTEYEIVKSDGSLHVMQDSQLKLKLDDKFKFTFVYDIVNGVYHSFADKKLIDSGSVENVFPERFDFDANLSTLYIGSPRQTSPYLTEYSIDGNAVSGKTVTANCIAISENGAKTELNQIKWYIDHIAVSHGENFEIPAGSEGKLLYYTVDVSNAYGESNNIKSDEIYIRNLFDASYSAGNISLRINNIWETEQNINFFVKLEKEEKITDVFVFPVNVSGEYYENIFALPQNTEFDKVSVFLASADTYSPVSSEKTVYGSETSEISGEKCVVYVLRPADRTDVISAFEKSYTLTELSPESDGSISRYLSDVCVIKSSETYVLYCEESGLYSIVKVNENGTSNIEEKYIGTQDLLDINGTQNLSDSRIVALLCAITKREESYVNSAIDIYGHIENKHSVISLAESCLEKVYASIYLSMLLEKSEPDISLIKLTKEELTAIGADYSALDLLAANINYSEVISVFKENLPGDIIGFLSILKEASVLCGVKNVVSYKDAKIFLKEIGNAKYNNASDDDKNTIAKAVYGRSYSSISELSSDINNIKLSSSGGGGTSGGSSSGRLSGTVSAGSFTGNIVPKNEALQPYVFFSDVPSSHWAFAAVSALAEKKIINGYDGRFNPDNFVTRAEFLKILCVAFGIPVSDKQSFADVPSDSWYAQYVNGAFEKGLIFGDGKNFKPENNITRQDAAVMVYRFAEYAGYKITGASGGFADGNLISDYARDAVLAMNSSGIINGVGNNSFAPLDNATRSQAAQIIYKVISREEDRQ